MSKFTISYACATDAGLIRTTNQDNFICDGRYMDASGNIQPGILSGETDNSDIRLFGVFDGMGGEDKGEMAAYLAADEAALADLHGDAAANIRDLCMRANSRICWYIADHDDVFSMGTTAAMLAFTPENIVLCNIGDSKVFSLSDNMLRQVSQDHLMFAPYGTKPPLSQNLGIPESELIIDPYFDDFKYKDGDIYLICSDGLTDMLKAYEIEEILTHADDLMLNETVHAPAAASANDIQVFDLAGRTDLAAQVEKLINTAKQNGGRDNITVILLKINEE